MGGCVVPPGTAAMCQTGGEEERQREGVSRQKRGRERTNERGREGGREGAREGCRRKKETLPGCPSAVSQNNI